MTTPYRVTHLTLRSEVFSDGFSEGQLRDIDDGFPSDSNPYTEDYDYLSDSDLEDASSCSGDDEEEPQGDDNKSSQRGPDNTGHTRKLRTDTPNDRPSSPSSDDKTEAQSDDRSSCFPLDSHRRSNSNLQRWTLKNG